ncbi:methyl-accepting chemotaxis protein [Natronobacillus azotifigens]|uniref:Methyl-accepting chemotaxis protein n=1 Tax=Natronobacillus azotifigens TaxID=472978 RepID=A0A9J6RCJ6_9BACI|nr:methyl-accepting chemotaxis protein [Natronobacillus azotifigens]MCZ0703434.1 methyl-accepting chemotaxis protein [Natronobacillus azotifigens]
MSKFSNMFHSISTKLMLLVTVIILITGALVGTTSYYIARSQLLEAGERDLKSIVDGSLASLELLNENVELGIFSLEEAQEQARLVLGGPVNEEGNYDYLSSQFSYKQDGYLLAYDQDYVLQIHPSRVGQEPPNEHTRNNRAMMVAAGQASGIEDQYVIYADLQEDGSYRDKTAYMQHFEPWDWTIGMVVFQDEFYEDLNTLSTFILLSTFVLVILSTLVFYFLTRSKIKLLKNVADVSNNIAEGKIYQTNLKESSDEIGQLATAFNKMSVELKTLVTNVQKTSTHLLDSATDLSAISEETSASSQEVGEAIAEIATGTQEQANDLEDINSRVDLLTKAITAMASQNEKMSTLTTKTATLSTEGSEIIERLQTSNAESLTASQQVSNEIKDLSDKVKEITKVMDTIENIAEETNLLALNASIEAARAGEHGKGFSVVAEEIRKLAEQSKGATHQVQSVVSAIVNETASTVKTVEGTMKTAEELSTDVISTRSKFGQLSLSVEDIVSSLNLVKQEIDTITDHNKEMSAAIESASSVSEETAASVEEITSSIDEQVRVMGNVAESAEQLTHLNQELSNLIEKYDVMS